MTREHPTKLADQFLARQLARQRPEIAAETLNENEREQRSVLAVEVLELVSRLRGNADFQQFEEWVRMMVAEKRRVLMRPDLPDADTPRAKAQYLAALEFANLLVEQEMTARRLLDPKDPRIESLAEMRLS